MRSAQFPVNVSQSHLQEETGYDKIQRTLAAMRREELLPFEWIVDNTRWEQRPYTCTDIAEALQETAEQYRKTLWTDEDPCVQIWLEKDWGGKAASWSTVLHLSPWRL
jgi:hypothetical protein